MTPAALASGAVAERLRPGDRAPLAATGDDALLGHARRLLRVPRGPGPGPVGRLRVPQFDLPARRPAARPRGHGAGGLRGRLRAAGRARAASRAGDPAAGHGRGLRRRPGDLRPHAHERRHPVGDRRVAPHLARGGGPHHARAARLLPRRRGGAGGPGRACLPDVALRRARERLPAVGPHQHGALRDGGAGLDARPLRAHERDHRPPAHDRPRQPLADQRARHPRHAGRPARRGPRGHDPAEQPARAAAPRAASVGAAPAARRVLAGDRAHAGRRGGAAPAMRSSSCACRAPTPSWRCTSSPSAPGIPRPRWCSSRTWGGCAPRPSR